LIYHRRAMARLLALLVALALISPAPAAFAQGGGGGAFGPLPPAQPAETPKPEEPKDSGSGEVSRQTLFMVALGVIASFFVLGWLITRDARRNLTDEDRAAVDSERTGEPLKKQDRAKAKQRAREKTRAQRQARKKTRRAGRR
jgi:hypothetical protein